MLGINIYLSRERIFNYRIIYTTSSINPKFLGGKIALRNYFCIILFYFEI